MIVACIALVFAMGGTSYAAIVLPANSVGTAQLKANSVTGAKVKSGSLTTADISANSLSTLGRIAIGSGSVFIPAGTTGTVATVSLTAPKRGFVLVTGHVDEDSATGTWGVRVWDLDAGAHSPFYVGQTTTSEGDSSATNTAVFPVTAGARTFAVNVDWSNSTTGMNAYGTITAQFIPYGPSGSSTSLGATKGRMEAPPQHSQQ
jgi:hypothetical protein